jgi:uncharacterized membrane protein YciS (DUF1049 family)
MRDIGSATNLVVVKAKAIDTIAEVNYTIAAVNYTIAAVNYTIAASEGGIVIGGGYWIEMSLRWMLLPQLLKLLYQNLQKIEHFEQIHT